MMGRNGVERLPQELAPALLISFAYLPPFEAAKHRYMYRDWALDSGAYTAYSRGMEVDLQEYIDKCQCLLDSDPKLREVFALDVIGDWEASARNTEEMWRQGVPAIPCFHYGEPWQALLDMAGKYPKIALGGMVGQKVEPRDKWIAQCFARVWPKRIHGFGLAGEKTIMRFPFDSVDATNWEIGPCKFGMWRSFGRARISVRGSSQNLRAEVEWYLDLERRARERWRKEMQKLNALSPDSAPLPSGCNDYAPTVRLVTQGQGSRWHRNQTGMNDVESNGGK